MNCEFVGAGIRPPGVFNFEFNNTNTKMNTCVFISTLHKLMRRGETAHLNGVMKGAFIALMKRELTSGIKSVITQFRNRVFITLIEEGVILFMTPERGSKTIHIVTKMFSVYATLEKRLDLVDEFCECIHGCYRGRVPSFMNSWFMTDGETLDKLNINRPPGLELMSKTNVDAMLACKLSTKKGKGEFKSIIEKTGTWYSWIHKLIQEVEHIEFNKLMYFSSVASLEFSIYDDVGGGYNGGMSIPTISHLTDIGVFDCHSGKGDFNDFLDKGVLVSNKAPIKLYGLDSDETENMYIAVKKEIGSNRWAKKKVNKGAKTKIKTKEEKIIEIETKIEKLEKLVVTLNEKEGSSSNLDVYMVIAQLPTSKHKPVVIYNVMDGVIDGSGFKQFKLKNQYTRAKEFDSLLRLAGSPAMPDNLEWDIDRLCMVFSPIPGTTKGDESDAVMAETTCSNWAMENKIVKVLPRNKLGVKLFREVENKEIIIKNVERFVKHCIVAALLDIGDQSPNNFILTNDTIYSVDNADKRSNFNVDEKELLSLLTNKPMKKGSLLRTECEKYIESNKCELRKFIDNVDNSYDPYNRKSVMIGLL
tara:strand:+ start:2519 stop:4282 length:1764 start_codon:yes stop_codon:yes gene_type:complete